MPCPAAPGIRVVTVVEDQGAPVAALVHDPAAMRDETLAQSVAAAVRLAVANVRLQVDVAARVGEVAASRRRLVEAGDEQRRRLRDELRSGAERGLADVSRDLAGLARDRRARRPPRSRPSWQSSRPRAETSRGSRRACIRLRSPSMACPPLWSSWQTRPPSLLPSSALAALPGPAGGGRVLRVLGGAGQRRQVRRGVRGADRVDAPVGG